MLYSVELVKDGEYVNIKLWGAIDGRTARRARDEALDLLAAISWNRIFVDLSRVERLPSTMFQYHFTLELKSKLPLDARVALLVNGQFHDDAYFIQTVSQNNGLDQRMFFEKEKAVAWLCWKMGMQPDTGIPVNRRAYGKQN